VLLAGRGLTVWEVNARIGSALIQWRLRYLDVHAHLIGHDVSWCRWCRTVTPAMHRAQLSCQLPPSMGSRRLG